MRAFGVGGICGVALFLAVVLYIVFFENGKKTPPAAATVAEHAAVIDEVDLGNGVRLRVVEIPDRVMPYRCVVLTTPERSTMQCPADAAASP